VDTPAYLLESQQPAKHHFAYLGIPHDAATTLANPGARFAPPALREFVRNFFAWRLRDGKLADTDLGIKDLSAVEVADFGDVALSYHNTVKTVDESYQAVRQVIEARYVPLIVGGDHGISYPAIKALHDSSSGRIGLIQLDAHRDLADGNPRQGRFSGSSVMRRSLELERLAGKNFVQVGLRGYSTVEQYEATINLGARLITASQFSELGAKAAARQAVEWASEGTQAIYLTVDMDVLTPGEAPGTGWPEPGGMTGQQLIDFVRGVAPHCAAMDIAELNPIYDSPARATAMLGARLLLDFIIARV